MQRVAFEDASQLIQAHRKRFKARDDPGCEQCPELVRQDIVTFPVPLPERADQAVRWRCRIVRMLFQREQHHVAEDLQSVLRHGRTGDFRDNRLVLIAKCQP